MPASKVFVCPQPVNRSRFAPPSLPVAPDRPASRLLCRVFGPEKGVHRLLRAGRIAGPTKFRFEFVGATGDRGSKALLARERVGLDVIVKPGDPVMAYHQAELFVLPSLEDGFGFVVAEAMSCGVPVVVTDQCGAAEWVRPGESGWVIPAGDEKALAAVLGEALARRNRLVDMGRAAWEGMTLRDSNTSLRLLGERVVSFSSRTSSRPT